MAFEETGENGNAYRSIDELYIRLRWGIREARPRPPLPMSSGFVALATGHARPLPLRPGSAFGTQLPRAFPWLRPGSVPPAPPMVAVAASSTSAGQLVHERPTKRRRDLIPEAGSAEDPEDKARTDALEAWANLVSTMEGASTLFLQMAASQTTAEETFKAAFYGKPASTLGKRATALGLYLRWTAAQQIPPWPVTEDVAFLYVRHLVAHRAPPTRAQSFREALGFAKGYVGLQGVEAVLSSRRVVGAVQEALDSRAERVQRDTLKVLMVKFLESAIAGGPTEYQVLVGFLLFCVHARARVGDAVRGDKEPVLDTPDAEVPFGFVEAGFLKHKTSYRNRSRLRLPVVADAFGLAGVSWAKVWLDARRAAGLNAERDGFLMPTVYGNLPRMKFGNKRATTAEISSLIKEVLAAAGAGWDLDRTSSHSLKPTLLSWCAKFGLPLPIRRKLGGHAKARDKAVLAYSRDELSEPMRELQRVLKAISDGVFDPDATRSGLWLGQAPVHNKAVESPDGGRDPGADAVRDEDDFRYVEAPPPAEHATPDYNVESSSSSVNSSDDSMASQVDEQVDHYVNTVNNVHHLRHESDPTRLRCGKLMDKITGLRAADFTAAYAQAAERCKGCYR